MPVGPFESKSDPNVPAQRNSREAKENLHNPVPTKEEPHRQKSTYTASNLPSTLPV